MLLADINIFDRLIKVHARTPNHILPHAPQSTAHRTCLVCAQVCYDILNGGAKLREEVSVSMVWWHTYKFVAAAVWKFFARDVFVPLFHHLFPGQHFYLAPKSLSVIISMFQIAKLAYGNYLDAEVTKVRKGGSIPAADFTFLCENAIPAVPSASLCHEPRLNVLFFCVTCVCLVANENRNAI